MKDTHKWLGNSMHMRVSPFSVAGLKPRRGKANRHTFPVYPRNLVWGTVTVVHFISMAVSLGMTAAFTTTSESNCVLFWVCMVYGYLRRGLHAWYALTKELFWLLLLVVLLLVLSFARLHKFFVALRFLCISCFSLVKLRKHLMC